jgi:hypothetical protein
MIRSKYGTLFKSSLPLSCEAHMSQDPFSNNITWVLIEWPRVVHISGILLCLKFLPPWGYFYWSGPLVKRVISGRISIPAQMRMYPYIYPSMPAIPSCELAALVKLSISSTLHKVNASKASHRLTFQGLPFQFHFHLSTSKSAGSLSHEMESRLRYPPASSWASAISLR